MRRVPVTIVVLSIPAVVGTTWWAGTRDYDFLRKPTATEIETAKTRATAGLARPADLFAIDPTDKAAPAPTPAAPAPPPKPKPKPPRIDVSDPTTVPPVDAWIERSDLPAASFIELASRLESDAHLAWARVTWERVLDLADAAPDDREVAVRAIGRIRASLPVAAEVPDGAPVVELQVAAPADRIELTRRAATEAAEVLESAADHSIRFKLSLTKDTGEEPGMRIALRPPSSADATPASVSTPAPADPDVIRRTILGSCFKLVASALATEDGLPPVPPAAAGEPPADSLSHRITRRAWAIYARQP